MQPSQLHAFSIIGSRFDCGWHAHALWATSYSIFSQISYGSCGTLRLLVLTAQRARPLWQSSREARRRIRVSIAVSSIAVSGIACMLSFPVPVRAPSKIVSDDRGPESRFCCSLPLCRRYAKQSIGADVGRGNHRQTDARCVPV
jgi:hypothetical protein